MRGFLEALANLLLDLGREGTPVLRGKRSQRVERQREDHFVRGEDGPALLGRQPGEALLRRDAREALFGRDGVESVQPMRSRSSSSVGVIEATTRTSVRSSRWGRRSMWVVS